MTDRPLTGLQIGPYRLEQVLGEGGMGTVYRAVDTRLNRPVAIKFLSNELADADARRRFQREAQTASSLSHPHIVTVHDAGEFEERQYLVTEFIDGWTLKDWARTQKRHWRQIVELLAGVADGLAEAHAAGIMHRDIKPANILVAKNGYAKLADFGLAKLIDATAASEHSLTRTADPTRPGLIIGTIAYMSPEQAMARPLDARSDIFSFGVVLYEVLAGRRPFGGASDVDLLANIKDAAAPTLSADVPSAVQGVVEKALEKDPADRYQSMRELAIDLRRLSRQSPKSSPSLRTSAPAPEHLWRWRWWLAGAAVLSVSLIVAVPKMYGPSLQREPTRVDYTQITNFADSAHSPALSPDGRMLAFIRGDNTFIGQGQIYVTLLPEGDPVQLTHDTRMKMNPRFTPDGSRITYGVLELKEAAASWDMWIVPVLGGTPRLFMANAEGLTWIPEPTGQPRLLFSEMTGKTIQMALMTSTESRAQPRVVYMPPETGMAHRSYLSPDRKVVLVAEMDFNGWLPCRLLPFDGISPGRQVGPERASCTDAAWSPDGAWMYFTANPGAGSHVWRQRFPDGPVEQVTSGVTEEEGTEFAADGRSFLTSIGTVQSTVWLHDASGDRQITSQGYGFLPSISADGKRLYYLDRPASSGATTSAASRARGAHAVNGGLWVVGVESGQRQRLLPEFLIQHYTVAPDGRRIVFVAAGDDERTPVWLATLDGGAPPRQLTSLDGVQAFFGKGDDVIFSSYENDGKTNFIYRVKEDGSGLKKVIPSPVFFLYGVSPDGGSISVWEYGSTRDTQGSVRVHPVGGGEPKFICSNCGGRGGGLEPQAVSWSPDGRYLFIYFWQQATFAIPLNRGETVPATFPAAGIRSLQEVASLPGVKTFPVPGPFLGPTVDSYAFVRVSAQRNVYRVPVSE